MKLNGHLASHDARGKRYAAGLTKVSAQHDWACARSRRLEDNTCPSWSSRGLKRYRAPSFREDGGSFFDKRVRHTLVQDTRLALKRVVVQRGSRTGILHRDLI